MVKFIRCYQLEKRKCFSIYRKILSVTFSEKLVFLSACDLTILIYDINTFEELNCINTVGIAKFLTCDNEGNVLATIELNGKQSPKENAAVRIYLNLNSVIPGCNTKAIVAGSYARRKHFTKTYCELLPGKRTILSVELPLKDDPLAVDINSQSNNVLVGMNHRILVYAIVRHIGKSQTLDADVKLIMDIELNFKVRQISAFNEYLAASSKSECQVFMPKKEKETDFGSYGGNEIQSLGAVSKRSRTITRQQGFTFQEFFNKNEFEVRKGMTIQESVSGGVKICGTIPENSSICPKLEFLYDRNSFNDTSRSKPLTLVYYKCDCSSTLLTSLFYQIKDKSGRVCHTTHTYVLISTQNTASLYDISEESVCKCSFQFASTAFQVTVDEAHLFALGKNSLEVFTNPNISAKEQIKSEEVEPVLICIHELPERYKGFIRTFDQQIMILQMDNILEIAVFAKPSSQEETDMLLEASKHVNEDIDKHLRLQIQTLLNSELLQ